MSNRSWGNCSDSAAFTQLALRRFTSDCHIRWGLGAGIDRGAGVTEVTTITILTKMTKVTNNNEFFILVMLIFYRGGLD